MAPMTAPNVVTTSTIKKKNLVFRVHAYRKLSPAEMRGAFWQWMYDTRRKKIPTNMIIDYSAIHGFDS